MCTVTLLPNPNCENGFVLTSNRDEAAERKAIPPKIYEVDGVKMLFPKDEVAGGTWIGVSEYGRLICLLNGAFEAHVRKAGYRKSRGVVVTELLAAVNIDAALQHYLLQDIEPFTVILVDWSKRLRFLEYVWDGKMRHIKELTLEPHIWSSSPLYNKAMRQKRINWFKKFLENEVSSKKLLEFHHTGGEGNKEIDFIMDRGFVKTQSITQIKNCQKYTMMTYEDLTTGLIKEDKILKKV